MKVPSTSSLLNVALTLGILTLSCSQLSILYELFHIALFDAAGSFGIAWFA
jgi:hypothetical protein